MSNRVVAFPPRTTSPEFAPAKRPILTSGDVGEMVEPVQNLILKYPAAALASAFLVGVVVAWWIKRR